MKFVTCELHKVALAALLLGVFSLSPIAKAEDSVQAPAPKAPASAPDPWLMGADGESDLALRDGVRYSEIQKMPHTSLRFEISKDESTGKSMLVFKGKLPRGCANDATVDDEVTLKDGRHGFKINMPNCPAGKLSKLTDPNSSDRDIVIASKFLPAKEINLNSDGEVCLLWTDDGGDSVQCDNVPGLKTTAVADQKESDRLSEQQLEADRKKAENEAARAEWNNYGKKRALLQSMKLACEQGDKERFTHELNALVSDLGDIQQYLDSFDVAMQKKYAVDIKKAKTADAARIAFDAFMTKAMEGGWDTEQLSKSYAAKRIELMTDLLSSEGDVQEKADAIADLRDDLELVDDLETKDVFKNVTWAYQTLADTLKDANSYDKAEQYYTMALKTATKQEKADIEVKMAKMFNLAADECLAENKLNPGKCDALANKARKHMDGAIAAQSKAGGDSLDQVLGQMQAERIQSFGGQGAPSMNIKTSYTNFGIYNQSEWTARKMQMFQQGQMEQQQQMMLQQQMGGQQQQPGAPGGSIFR